MNIQIEKKSIHILILLLTLVFSLYRLTSQAQNIRTFAGGATSGGPGDGGPATLARVFNPSAVCLDGLGNVYFSDQNYCNVRMVDPAGIIHTVAGRYSATGGSSCGYNGDGIPADSAQLFYPEGIAVDRFGNLYIADQLNNRIRKVAHDTMYTVCGTGSIGDTGSGGPATNALLWHPADVGVDYAGNVYFVDQDNSKMKRIDTAGTLTTLAGTGVAGFSGDGGPATAAQLNWPNGIAADSMGNVYIADLYNSRVRRVDAITGIITTIAGTDSSSSTCGAGGPATATCSGFCGDGGSAISACITDPAAVGLNHKGDIFISDFYNYRIRKIDSAGTMSSIAGSGTYGFSGDGGPATDASLNYTQGVTGNDSGTVYIADYENGRVRIINKPPVRTNYLSDQLTAIDVFPNPATGMLKIHTTAGDFLNASIQLHNLLGEKLMDFYLKSNNTDIDLTNYPNGIYYLYFSSEKRTYIKKITVIH